MSQLKELFTGLGIHEEKLRSLAAVLMKNPIAAMMEVHALSLPDGTIQRAMDIVIADPGEMTLFATSLGLDESIVAKAKKKLDGMSSRH